MGLKNWSQVRFKSWSGDSEYITKTVGQLGNPSPGFHLSVKLIFEKFAKKKKEKKKCELGAFQSSGWSGQTTLVLSEDGGIDKVP